MWLGGGLREHEDRVPVVEPGARVRGVRLAFIAERAQLTARDPRRLDSGRGRPGRYLVILLRVTNVSDETVSADASLHRDLRIRLLADGRPATTLTARPATYLERDRSLADFHPDLPERVLLAVPLGAEPDPHGVELTFFDEVFREDFFEERRVWRPSDDVLGRTVLPVEV